MIGYGLIIAGLAVLFYINPEMGLAGTLIIAGFNIVLIDSFRQSAKAVSKFTHDNFVKK